MEVTLIFYNGDSCVERVAGLVPPGRLYWCIDADAQDVRGLMSDESAESQCDRVFWLDVLTWASTQRAEYREVAKRPR